MNNHWNDYHLIRNHETQQARLLDEARRERLKAEVLAAARLQRQMRRPQQRTATLRHWLTSLRAALAGPTPQRENPDCAGMKQQPADLT